MTSRELAEYAALRSTIGQRGTARVWVMVAGLGIWGGLALTILAATATPVSALIPLLFLAGVFEAVFALHTGVERVGRYLQVFYEGAVGDPGSVRHWEHTAMALGRTAARRGPDPLFGWLFGLAAGCNVVPMLATTPVPIEWAVVGLAHLLFVGRVLAARRYAAHQRAADLEYFEALEHP